MGRTVEAIKYGISAPTVKNISSLWRMNEFVSPERVKQRNRVLARQNALMKKAALDDYNKVYRHLIRAVIGAEVWASTSTSTNTGSCWTN